MNLSLVLFFGMLIVVVFAVCIVLVGKTPVRAMLMAGIVGVFAVLGLLAQAVAL